jgi:hypothetical protein
VNLLKEFGKLLMGYKDCFEIMGKDQNSYSKTDLKATFMRMKEYHMLNGQLKPAYKICCTCRKRGLPAILSFKITKNEKAAPYRRTSGSITT